MVNQSTEKKNTRQIQMTIEGHKVTISFAQEANPTLSTVEAIASAIREQNIATVVAVGGGSSMDAAKMLAKNRLFFPVFIMKTPPSIVKDYYEEAASGNRLPCGKVFRLGPWLCETGFHRSCPCLYNLLLTE